MIRTNDRTWRLLAATAALAAAMPARAHHLMGGRAPQTFVDGLVSGLAHPVIGPDHFASVLAVGLIASLSARWAALSCAFMLAMIGGVMLHVARVDLPWTELGIAMSMVLLGFGLVRSVAKPAIVAVLFISTGIVHGYAYGESIVGAQAAPLGAHLLGLFVVQSAVACCAGIVARKLSGSQPGRTLAAMRASGLAAAAFGVVLLMIALARA